MLNSRGRILAEVIAEKLMSLEGIKCIYERSDAEVRSLGVCQKDVGLCVENHLKTFKFLGSP
jgi:hypothetical protein